MNFIDGITVLNEIPITKQSPIWATAFWIVIIIFAITISITVLFSWIDTKTSKNTEAAAKIFWILSWIMGGVTIIVAIFWSCIEVPTGEYRYQVTIDENTNFVEFYEKYDLIKQDGKIYTIEVKGEN